MKGKILVLAGIAALFALFSVSAASAYFESGPQGTYWVRECAGTGCGGGGSWGTNWGTWFSRTRDYSGYDYNYGKFNYPPPSNWGASFTWQSNWGPWFSRSRDYTGYDYNYGKFNYPCW